MDHMWGVCVCALGCLEPPRPLGELCSSWRSGAKSVCRSLCSRLALFSSFSMLVTEMSVSVSGPRADPIASFSFGEHLLGENTTPHFSDNIAL